MQIWAVLGLVLVLAGGAFYVDSNAAARAEGGRLQEALDHNQDKAVELQAARQVAETANDELQVRARVIRDTADARIAYLRQSQAVAALQLQQVEGERNAALAAIPPAPAPGELPFCPIDCRIQE